MGCIWFQSYYGTKGQSYFRRLAHIVISYKARFAGFLPFLSFRVTFNGHLFRYYRCSGEGQWHRNILKDLDRSCLAFQYALATNCSPPNQKNWHTLPRTSLRGVPTGPLFCTDVGLACSNGDQVKAAKSSRL